MRTTWILLLGLGWAALPLPASADPCEAPLPVPAAAFSGEVHYVGDGDSLCVGRSPDPKTWIEVRLADFSAPELSEPGGEQAKQTLARLVLRSRVACVAEHRSYDRIVARCTLAGTSIGELMRRNGVAEGGRGRR